VFSGESGKVLVWVGVVLLELLDDILADVGVVLLDLLRTTISIVQKDRTYTLSWSSGGI
jgi:hypothetical protein